MIIKKSSKKKLNITNNLNQTSTKFQKIKTKLNYFFQKCLNKIKILKLKIRNLSNKKLKCLRKMKFQNIILKQPMKEEWKFQLS